MRKEARQEQQVTLSRVQGYHQNASAGNYAFQGYTTRKYFTSDRFISLDESFNRPDGLPLQGYGLEIETECSGIRNETVLAEILTNVVFKQFPADLFKLQHDGSLGGDTSAECITQVMTQAFIRNNYKAFKSMFNTYFPALGISAVRSGACGMHVNISNACFGKSEKVQNDSIRKLLYFVNHHYGFTCALVNRDIRHTRYCSRMTAFTVKENAKNANFDNFYSDHGVCFNLGHYREGRIELRIVGGQKDFACFRNTMESVFFLVNNLKNIAWRDLDDLEKVFKGCNQYVADRIATKCVEAGTISIESARAIKENCVREELL